MKRPCRALAVCTSFLMDKSVVLAEPESYKPPVGADPIHPAVLREIAKGTRKCADGTRANPLHNDPDAVVCWRHPIRTALRRMSWRRGSR